MSGVIQGFNPSLYISGIPINLPANANSFPLSTNPIYSIELDNPVSTREQLEKCVDDEAAMGRIQQDEEARQEKLKVDFDTIYNGSGVSMNCSGVVLPGYIPVNIPQYTLGTSMPAPTKSKVSFVNKCIDFCQSFLPIGT